MTAAPPSWHRAAYSIDAMRVMAQRALPRSIFDFADGGTENEYTLRRNEAAFSRIEFLPRPLQGVADRDLSVELFGRRLALPVMIGPTGLSGLFWPGGEIAAARAAAAAGTAFCLSHGSTCTIEELAATSVAPRWMQIFVYRDRGFTREFVDRAAACGFDALVLTTDTQLVVNRERDIRNGFTIPPRFSPLDVAAMAGKLPWLMRMGPGISKISFANYASLGGKADIGSLAAKLPGMLDPSMSWREVEWLRGLWKGPFLLKGIVHPKEAAEASQGGRRGRGTGGRRGDRLEPWRPAAQRHAGLSGRLAGRARRGSRTHPGAAGRRYPARRGCRQGAGAGCLALPDRTPASVWFGRGR